MFNQKEYNKQYWQKNKEWLKERNRQYRLEHKEELALKSAIRIRKWYKTNKEYSNERNKEYYQAHREEVLERTHKYNKEHSIGINIQNAVSNQAIRVEVLTHYGNGQCVCVQCGFDDIRALSIDHINGGGIKEREKVGNKGVNFYAWLKRNGYPEGYQTLCMNCQLRKKLDNKEQAKYNPSEADNSKKGDRVYSPKYNYTYYHTHRAEVAKWTANNSLRLKKETLTHYGNGKLVCVNCGEDDIRCLSIDHINGNGVEERRRIGIGRGNAIYAWLKRNNYPVGYQTLCMNDQFIKRVENKEQTKITPKVEVISHE